MQFCCCGAGANVDCCCVVGREEDHCELFLRVKCVEGGTVLNGGQTKRLARSTCVATVLNTASALGFMTYILVRESQNTLPKYFVWWRKTSFTREFYVCVAFPSIFDGTERFESAERIYGFPACGVAVSWLTFIGLLQWAGLTMKQLAAKYVLIAICCVSTVLAGLSVLQAQKSGAFGGRGKRLDMEKAWPGKIEGERSNGLPKQLKASIRGALQEKNVIAPRRAHGEIRMPFAAMPRVEKPRLDRYF